MIDVLGLSAEVIFEWLKSTASDRKHSCFRFHRITERYVVRYWHVCCQTGFLFNHCVDVNTQPIGRNCCTLCETHGPVCIVCGLHASTAAMNEMRPQHLPPQTPTEDRSHFICIGKREATSDRVCAICTFIPPPSREIRIQRCCRPARPGAVHEPVSPSRTFFSLRSGYHCSSKMLYGRSGHGVSHDNAVRSTVVQAFR